MTGAVEALLARFGDESCLAPPPPSASRRWDGTEAPAPAAVLRPGSAEELQAMVRACIEQGVAMVPQGGGTGLSGGGWPTGGEGRPVAAISLGRLDRVREVDPVNRSMIVEAGVTARDADTAARAHGLGLPLHFGAVGSAQIGGVVSTNAGGMRSWRHGTVRDLVIGIEAVMADGRLWSGLRKVRKSTAGIDLSSLLVGSEGTLGIVTAAALRLAVPSLAHRTAFVSVARTEDAITLFRRFEAGGTLEIAELISGTGLRHYAAANGVSAVPVGLGQPWFMLLEWGAADGVALAAVDDMLAGALADGVIADGALAKSEDERARFHAIREGHGRACRLVGEPVAHDVAVPVSHVPEFLARAAALTERRLPGAEAVPICHLGDGNVHFDLLRPRGGDWDRTAAWQLTRDLHDLAMALGGSFSAEHGIGTERRAELRRLVHSESYTLMRTVKDALDPHGLLNPGKVL